VTAGSEEGGMIGRRHRAIGNEEAGVAKNNGNGGESEMT